MHKIAKHKLYYGGKESDIMFTKFIELCPDWQNKYTMSDIDWKEELTLHGYSWKKYDKCGKLKKLNVLHRICVYFKYILGF